MQYLDRIQDTSVTGGTGTLTLSGTPPSGFRAFSLLTTGASNIPYVATQGAAYEIGIGTLVTSTTFSRDTVLVSSNANSAVNFAASSITIFNDIPSTEILKLISTAATIVTSVASQASSTIVMIESGVAKQITVNNLLSAIGLTASALSPAAALSGSDVLVISQDGGATEVRTTLAALVAYIATSGYTGSSAGIGSAYGVGRSLFAAVGSASGVGTASGVATPSGYIGASSGTSAVTAVGASTAASVGASSGASSVTAVGSSGSANLYKVNLYVSGTGAGTAQDRNLSIATGYVASPITYYTVNLAGGGSPTAATINAGTGVRSAVIITTTDVAPVSPTFLGDTTSNNGYWHATSAGTFPAYGENSFIWLPSGATAAQVYYAWLYVRTGDNEINPVWQNAGTTPQRVKITITA